MPVERYPIHGGASFAIHNIKTRGHRRDRERQYSLGMILTVSNEGTPKADTSVTTPMISPNSANASRPSKATSRTALIRGMTRTDRGPETEAVFASAAPRAVPGPGLRTERARSSAQRSTRFRCSVTRIATPEIFLKVVHEVWIEYFLRLASGNDASVGANSSSLRKQPVRCGHPLLMMKTIDGAGEAVGSEMEFLNEYQTLKPI